MNFNSELVKNLTRIIGVSGQEERVQSFIINEIKDYVDEVKVDKLGNVIARKKGSGKRIMFSAHMDQIGFMVTDIDEKGFLRVSPVGGLTPMIMVGQRVVFENGIQGIVGYEKLDNISQLVLGKLYIDIAALSQEEAKSKISIGDVCTFETSFYENESCVISKALDDRVACYILIEAIKAQKESENDIYYAFTVQEETAITGAQTAGYAIDPEIAVAVDVTHVGDTHDGIKMAVKLGDGAAIKLKDSGTLTHPFVKRIMTEVAEENNIKYQYEILEGGATDTASIHKLRAGVPCGTISIPTRWIHGGSEIVCKEDVINCIELAIGIQNKSYN